MFRTANQPVYCCTTPDTIPPDEKIQGFRLRGISLREVILKHQKNGETWLIEVYVFSLPLPTMRKGKKNQPFTARGPSS